MVAVEEYSRKYALHVLPSGFRKIRHFGLLALRSKTERIVEFLRLTASTPPAPLLSTLELLEKIFGLATAPDICPGFHQN